MDEPRTWRQQSPDVTRRVMQSNRDGDFWHGNRWHLHGLPRLDDDFPTAVQGMGWKQGTFTAIMP